MIMKNDKRVVEVFKGDIEIGTIKHGTDTVFNNTSEYMGTLPVTINSARAENLKSYKFSGNIVQNGTPTPDAPIAVNGVGDLVESGEHAGQYAIPITSNGTTSTTIYSDKPLYGTGDVLDEYDSEGKIVWKWGVRVFDGSENWVLNTGQESTNTVYIYITDTFGTDATLLSNSKCTHFENRSVYGQDFQGFHILSGYAGLRIRVDKAIALTVNDFKSYLAAQYAAGTPVTVVYPLATPAEESITAPPLMLSKGINIVDVDTTVSPASAYLKWKGYK